MCDVCVMCVLCDVCVMCVLCDVCVMCVLCDVCVIMCDVCVVCCVMCVMCVCGVYICEVYVHVCVGSVVHAHMYIVSCISICDKCMCCGHHWVLQCVARVCPYQLQSLSWLASWQPPLLSSAWASPRLLPSPCRPSPQSTGGKNNKEIHLK